MPSEYTSSPPSDTGSSSGGGSAPSSEQYSQWAQQSVEMTSQIIAMKKESAALRAKTGCGSAPLIMKSKKGRAWEECMAKYRANIAAAKEHDRQIIAMQLRLKELNAKRNKGLSVGAWIGISVGAALLITTAIIIIVKIRKK